MADQVVDVEALLLGRRDERPADAHHRVGADLDVQVGGAVFDGNLQEVIDVHGLLSIGLLVLGP